MKYLPCLCLFGIATVLTIGIEKLENPFPRAEFALACYVAACASYALAHLFEQTERPFVRRCPDCHTELVSQAGHSVGTLHQICPKCRTCPDCDDGSV
jgi:hypothetical protein